MDRLRTAWLVVFVAGVAIGRYALPGANAEANAVATRETGPIARAVVRDVEPAKTHVLSEVLRCATQAVREDVAPPEIDGGPSVPEDTGDGLTDEQRQESEVALLEDALPRDRGAIQGQVHDATSGEPLVGVTVVVTAPELVGAQTAITDERGSYAITGLPAGDHYLTTFYYAELTVQRDDVVVGARKVTPVFQKLDQSVRRDAPVVIEFSGQGITIDESYIANIPVPGRTFESALEAAPDDGEGVSFSGGTPTENIYVVEE